MFVYRIVKSEKRTSDLSGTGAYRTGGRWNSKGVYMLYTSENSSLAYLETLVHYDESEHPPNLFVIKIRIDDKAKIYAPADKEYPADWMNAGHFKNKELGDSWMKEKNYLGVKVKSAINVLEFNYLFNPLFPRFYDLVTIEETTKIEIDTRFVRR